MELVQYDVRDRIAHVTIANGKANALSPEVIAGLGDALSRAEDAGEAEVGALLISGAPGMFSGGFDLQVMRSGPAAAGKLVTDGGELFARMYGSPLPVVVACTGHAIAAGALLLLGADARVGARGEFRIGLIETQLGMVLPRWAVELAQERLSKRHVQDATVGARIYDPDGAADAGFLDCGRGARGARRRGSGRGPALGGAVRGTPTAARSGCAGASGWAGWPRRSPPTGAGPSKCPVRDPGPANDGGSFGSRFSGVRALSCRWRSSPFSWWAPSTCCCGAPSSGGSPRCAGCSPRSKRATKC